MTIGSEVLLITTQRKGNSFDRLISRCTSQAGTANHITAIHTRSLVTACQARFKSVARFPQTFY
jgi:hypothetical protein